MSFVVLLELLNFLIQSFLFGGDYLGKMFEYFLRGYVLGWIKHRQIGMCSFKFGSYKSYLIQRAANACAQRAIAVSRFIYVLLS
jgi:hypothetical protein